jgi:NADPH2:quinone reductase
VKAIVCHAFGDFHDLKVEDSPPPPLVAGSVRIAVEAASISFATSLWVAGKYQHKPPLPFVPGSEFVGTVIECAPDARRFKPGARVLAVSGWGGYAEEAVVTEHTVYPIPADIDAGAALHLATSYATAYGALVWRARIEPGETLLVLAAAGGVGLAAVEIGCVLGAKVIAAAGGAEKCAIAKAHGAQAAIDYRMGDLRAEIRNATAGRGIDVVFDPVGGASFDAALRSLVPGGRHVVIGFAGGAIPQIPANLLLVKNIAVLGFNIGLWYGWSVNDERAKHEPEMRAAFEQIFAWYGEGRLSPLVSQVYPLARFADAQDAVLERRSVGKVVLKIGN